MPRGRPATPKVLSSLSGQPDMPDHLDTTARKEWDRIVSLLDETGNLSQVDGSALAIYCCAFSRFVEAEKHLSKNGMVILAPNGCQMKSPYVDISKQAEATMMKILTQFGLTPRARNTIRQTDKKQDDAKAKWENLLS